MSDQITVFMGQGNGSGLYKADSTYLDGAARYPARGRSVAVAPAGASGECVWPAVYLTVSNIAACTLRLTIYLDGVAQERTYDVAIPAHTSRLPVVYEVALLTELRDSMDPDTILGMGYPRSTWFALAWQTLVDDGGLVPGTGDDDFNLDGVDVEYEVVQESRVAQ